MFGGQGHRSAVVAESRSVAGQGAFLLTGARLYNVFSDHTSRSYMSPESKLPKIARSTLHEQTYRELRAAIMSARFAPGEKLTVRGIAADLGVSAMPVRAAFTRLVAELVVIQKPNGTIEIPEMTRSHYEELIMLRALLEGKAAELATLRATPEQIAELEEIANALTAASRSGDANAYISLNQRFKFALVEAAGVEALQDLVERLWLQVGPFMRYYAKEVHAQHDLDRHHEALEALKTRNGKAARKAIERDILDGVEFLFKSGVMA